MERAEGVKLEPKWRALVPAFVMVLEDGTDEGRRAAREELARMAEAADRWNDHAGRLDGLLNRLEVVQMFEVSPPLHELKEWAAELAADLRKGSE